SWTLLPLALVSAVLLCQLGAHLFSTAKPLNDVAGALAAMAVFFALAVGRKPAAAPVKTTPPRAYELPESWEDAEELLAAFYGQHGYAVEEVGRSGPYKGFDLALWKNGKKTLIQCRHWRIAWIDELTVHQLYRVQVAERATRSLMITHGKFTAGARRFAMEHEMELIDGARCAEMLRHLQDAPVETPALMSADDSFMLQQS
ncbi:MAG TPA: restriction endonuclease, partial [Verrucomicrobiae bacterium]|nr:restriction endonuclease [Verrucomicrobiae bacterium]